MRGKGGASRSSPNVATRCGWSSTQPRSGDGSSNASMISRIMHAHHEPADCAAARGATRRSAPCSTICRAMPAQLLPWTPNGHPKAVTMQLDRSCLLDLFAQGLRRSALTDPWRICSRLTPRLAQKSASQPLPSQLHGCGLPHISETKFTIDFPYGI